MAKGWLRACFRGCIQDDVNDYEGYDADLESTSTGYPPAYPRVREHPAYLLSDVQQQGFGGSEPTLLIVSTTNRPQRRGLGFGACLRLYVNASANKALLSGISESPTQQSHHNIERLQAAEPLLLKSLLAHLTLVAKVIKGESKDGQVASIFLDAASYSSQSYGGPGGVLRPWAYAVARPCCLRAPRAVAKSLPDNFSHPDPPPLHPQPSSPSVQPGASRWLKSRQQFVKDPSDEVLLPALAVRFVMTEQLPESVLSAPRPVAAASAPALQFARGRTPALRHHPIGSLTEDDLLSAADPLCPRSAIAGGPCNDIGASPVPQGPPVPHWLFCPEAVLSGLVCAVTAVYVGNGLVVYQNEASRQFWGDRMARDAGVGLTAAASIGGQLSAYTALTLSSPSPPPTGGAGAAAGAASGPRAGVAGRSVWTAASAGAAVAGVKGVAGEESAAAAEAAAGEQATAAAPLHGCQRGLRPPSSFLQPGLALMDVKEGECPPVTATAAATAIDGSGGGQGSCSSTVCVPPGAEGGGVDAAATAAAAANCAVDAGHGNSRRRGQDAAAYGGLMWGHAPGALGSDPGWRVRSVGEGLLQQLFALEPVKYDRMIQDVCVEGRAWRGIVQVPRATAHEPHPPAVHSAVARTSALAAGTSTVTPTAAGLASATATAVAPAPAGGSVRSNNLELLLASLQCDSLSPSGPCAVQSTEQSQPRRPLAPAPNRIQLAAQAQQRHPSDSASQPQSWLFNTGATGRCTERRQDSVNLYSTILLTGDDATGQAGATPGGTATSVAIATAAVSDGRLRQELNDATGGGDSQQVSGHRGPLVLLDNDPLATSVWGMLGSTAGSESLTLATAAAAMIANSGAAPATMVVPAGSGRFRAPYVPSGRVSLVSRPAVGAATGAAGAAAASAAVPRGRVLPGHPVLPASAPTTQMVCKVSVLLPSGISVPPVAREGYETQGLGSAAAVAAAAVALPLQRLQQQQRTLSAPALEHLQQLSPQPTSSQSRSGGEQQAPPSPSRLPSPTLPHQQRLTAALAQSMSAGSSNTALSRLRRSSLRGRSKLRRNSSQHGNGVHPDRPLTTTGQPNTPSGDLWRLLALARNSDATAATMTATSSLALNCNTSNVFGWGLSGRGRRGANQQASPIVQLTRHNQPPHPAPHLHAHPQPPCQRQQLRSEDDDPAEEDPGDLSDHILSAAIAPVATQGRAPDGVRNSRSCTSRLAPLSRSFVIPQRAPSSPALPRVVAFASSLRNAPAPVAMQQLVVQQASRDQGSPVTSCPCAAAGGPGSFGTIGLNPGRGSVPSSGGRGGSGGEGGSGGVSTLEARPLCSGGQRIGSGGGLHHRLLVPPFNSVVPSRAVSGVSTLRRCGSEASSALLKASTSGWLTRVGSSIMALGAGGGAFAAGSGADVDRDGAVTEQTSARQPGATSRRHMKMEHMELTEVEPVRGEAEVEEQAQGLLADEETGEQEGEEEEETAAEAMAATVTTGREEEEEAGHEAAQAEELLESWHEVTVTRATDPRTGQAVLLLVQNDVTGKVLTERHIALVSETEHRLLEQIFPRHVLAYMTEEGGPWAASGSAQAFHPAGWRPIVQDINKLATSHNEVTLLFADIQGFTPMCKVLEPRVIMAFLNDLFTRFDKRLDDFGVYKVETIGDCYFVAGGLVHEDEDGMVAVRGGSCHEDQLHAEKVFMFAKAMLEAASQVTLPTTGGPVRMRIGIHSGPVVSGVVGQRMPRFCLFGDTVNTTSRMESTGVPGCIHASEAARRLLRKEAWVPTGGIQVKGRGLMQTFLWAPPDMSPALEGQALLGKAGGSVGSGPGTLSPNSSSQPLKPQAQPQPQPVNRRTRSSCDQRDDDRHCHHHQHEQQRQQGDLARHLSLRWSQHQPWGPSSQLQPQVPLFPSQPGRERDRDRLLHLQGQSRATEPSDRAPSPLPYTSLTGRESQSRYQAESNACLASSASNAPPTMTDSGCELAALLLGAHSRLPPRRDGNAVVWEEASAE